MKNNVMMTISVMLIIAVAWSSCVKESSLTHAEKDSQANRIEAMNTLAPSDCFQENTKEAEESVIADIRRFAERNQIPLNWDEMSYSSCGQKLVVLVPIIFLKYSMEEVERGVDLAVVYVANQGEKLPDGVYVMNGSDRKIVLKSNKLKTPIELEASIKLADQAVIFGDCGAASICYDHNNNCCMAVSCTGAYFWTGCYAVE